MKLKALLLLATLSFTALLARPASAQAEVSFDFFFDALSPYGEWIDVGDYGSCWRPGGVDADWRPYADGYWSYTDGGWTWVSYEEFGGIVYHYGRWVQAEGEGWCWVPDSEWAPAWVSWRSSDDYVGWAPLPPEARWRRQTGFSVWVDTQFDIGPGRFNFCRVHDFGSPFLRPVIVAPYQNVTIIQSTANVTNISYFDGGGFGGLVHCGGPSFAFINQHAFRPVPALKLVQRTEINHITINNITNNNIGNVNVFNAEARGNQLTVLAPRIAQPTVEMRRPNPVRTIPAARITKGWEGVQDPAVATGIRTRMQQESRGLTPESAPARRVQAAEMKLVPAKADPNAPSPVRTTREASRGSRKSEPAPAIVSTPPVEKADPATPVDARTAERMARDRARTAPPVPTAGGATIAPPASMPEPRRTVQPAPVEKSVAEKKSGKEKSSTTSEPATSTPTQTPLPSRQITRSQPPGTVPTPGAMDERSRRATVQSRPDEEAAARARAQASAQERAASEQRARAAATERQRAAEDSTRRQKAQAESSRELQRRSMPAEVVRRSAPVEAPRVKPSDDGARQAAEAAASRQRQMESARAQQMESARRAQAQESARRTQMESARREQAASSARQQQMEAVRRAPAPAPAPQPQRSESVRREAPAPAPRPQMQRQAAPPPMQRQAAPPQKYSDSKGKDRPSESDLEALRKGRDR